MDPLEQAKRQDPTKDAHVMATGVANAFQMPWPRKPLGKPDSGKGKGQPGQARSTRTFRSRPTGKTHGYFHSRGKRKKGGDSLSGSWE